MLHVHGVLGELVRDFLARNKQELARLLQHAAKLRERLETHLFNGVVFGFLAQFDPGVAEPSEVFLDGEFARAFADCDIDPAFAVGEGVVIGKREEAIAVPFVPVGDHFGKVVAVGPERMRMKVALPVSLGLRLCDEVGGRPRRAVFARRCGRQNGGLMTTANSVPVNEAWLKSSTWQVGYITTKEVDARIRNH